MIALLGAMREEVDGLRKLMAVEEVVAVEGRRWFRGQGWGRKVLLAETGPGRTLAERAARTVLERNVVAAIVSLGFGGALSEGVRAGDVVLCATVHSAGRLAGDPPIHSDVGLLASALRGLEERRVAFILGSCVTSNRLVSRPEEKKALGGVFDVEAVEMESYWIARLAGERQVPFLAVRAITDSLAEELPPFDRFLDRDGRWMWGAVGAHFVAHLGDLAHLPRLYANTRRASQNLARAIDAIGAKL